ncbi:hypothetical protein N0V90_010194 [Kalmusia sp. IMI 367209]|nr:hypothetical protein N0V90_010194 [Kalmusia sp. IMI 367209]
MAPWTRKMCFSSISPAPQGPPMGGEIERARGMCDLAITLWEDRIDGILRMEAGFEIILCKFEGKVQRKSVVVVDGEKDEERGGRKVTGGWRYIKAVSERYHGIGGDRVKVNYEDFVSIFAFDEGGSMQLWKNDVVSDTPHPRLQNASPKQLGPIKDAVTEMVLRSEPSGEDEGRDWQAIADMVVKRYSASLHYLHTDASVRHSKEAFAAYLNTLLQPFVSPSARNTTLEIERCIAQFIPLLPVPPSRSASLAHSTLHTVTFHICSTLLNAFDASATTLSRSLAATSSPPYHALDLIDSLVGYLQWTTWKECGTCADEEVCFIPIWPWGSLENHKTPRCIKEDGVGHGYWGRMGPPPPDHEHPGDDERPGPEGPDLTPSSARQGWEHGSEQRIRHGGRRKGGRCDPQRHAHTHAPGHHHDGGGGGQGWGFWGRLRVIVVQVEEWFGWRRGPRHVDVEVRVSLANRRNR